MVDITRVTLTSLNITTTGKLRNVGSALIKHLPPPFMRGMLMSIRTMSMCGASVQGRYTR
jgi:hypothetical protein